MQRFVQYNDINCNSLYTALYKVFNAILQIPPADFLYVSGNIHTYLEYSQTLKQEIKELDVDCEFLFFWKFTII